MSAFFQAGLRIAMASLAAACIPAFAGNLTADAPIAHFKGNDKALFDEALNAVLDDPKDGTARSWSNPETKAGGEVKSVKSFNRGEAKCRTVNIANKAQGRTSDGTMNFCRSAAGKWTLAN